MGFNKERTEIKYCYQRRQIPLYSLFYKKRIEKQSGASCFKNASH